MGKEKADDFAEVDKAIMDIAQILYRKIRSGVSEDVEEKKFIQNLPALIAERVRLLMETQPAFFEEDTLAKTKVPSAEDIISMLPKKFFADPTKWIESQNNVPRRYTTGKNPVPTMGDMKELRKKTRDASNTKKIILHKNERPVYIFSKRLKPEEVEQVEAFRKAYELGVPVPRVLWTVSDKGNTYCWFEYINGFTIQEIGNDKLFDTPLTATAESQFNSHVGEIECLKTRQGFHDQLMSLWRTYIPDIKAFNMANSLQFFIDKCRDGIPHGDIAFNVSVGFSMFLPTKAQDITYDLKDILQQHGYGSLEEFCAFFDRCLQKRDEKTMGENLPDFEKITQELKRLALEAIKIYVKKWRNIVSKELFGRDTDDVVREKQRLQALCEKNGISHEDSNDKFLISLPDKGKADLYVINVLSFAKTSGK
jgi:hypothetical protein